MSQTEILIRLLLTIVFGSILGIETETREISAKGEKKAQAEESSRLGGIRTYSVLSLFGGVAGLLYNLGESEIVYIIFGSVIGLVLAAYILNIQVKKAFGLTTEIAVLITFLIGFLTTSGITEIFTIVFILVLLTFFMSQKRGFGKIIHNVSHSEISDLIKFGLTSIIILPLLPNQSYTVQDLFKILEIDYSSITNQDILGLSILNPFRLWMIVVVISGINLAAYILSKIVGKGKGIAITSLIGGFISSTSTTIALARKSKVDPTNAMEISGGIILSNAVSFLTVISLVSVLNLDLVYRILPSLLLMSFFGIFIGSVILIIESQNSSEKLKMKVPTSTFELGPAIKFVSIILVITIIIQLIQLVDNEAVLRIVTAFSGVVGLDPSAIATAELSKTGEISIENASIIILAANAVNLLAKIIYINLYGDRRINMYVVPGFLASIIISFIPIVFGV